MERRLITLAILGVTLATTGCQKQREMEQELLDLSQKVPRQFQLLKQQNEFLNRKVNTLNEKVEELTKSNATLSEELATYANRPDEVKLEIISEVNSRLLAAAKDQTDFKARMEEKINAKFTEVDERMDEEFAEMQVTLTHHTEFVQFVATEQDSLNRVIANRIDSRPWYQSIIGKWEDREREAAASRAN
jgi:cell division protein FtsB